MRKSWVSLIVWKAYKDTVLLRMAIWDSAVLSKALAPKFSIQRDTSISETDNNLVKIQNKLARQGAKNKTAGSK